jgi:tRNA (guanosine-2'-O-)-methyltransferase
MAKDILSRDTVTDDRTSRFQEVIAKRQNITVILENVHDPHNIGAVIRSCDAIGISEIFVLYTEESYNLMKQKIGKNASSGARKWVQAHYFGNLDECFDAVRTKYDAIYGTHLSESAHSLYDLDLSKPVALMFGNEQHGISEKALAKLDGNFIIPQYGMVQSLNISVACAVSLFEASRQRTVKGMYNDEYDANNPTHEAMFDKFLHRHFEYIRAKER